MRIALVTPAGARARNGNRHTALRWAAFLRAAGHRVAVSTQWPGSDADLLLALHARRSYDSIWRFAASYPQRRLLEIGRASCRERVVSSVGGGSGKETEM